MDKIPERIFLQIYCEEGPFEEDFDIPWDEVTWHRDSIWSDDVEYVLASKHDELKENYKSLYRTFQELRDLKNGNVRAFKEIYALATRVLNT